MKTINAFPQNAKNIFEVNEDQPARSRGRGYKGLSANFAGSPRFRCHFGPR